MIAKIPYDSISGLTPTQIQDFISDEPKYLVKEATVRDLLNENMLKVSLHEFTDNGFCSRGIYMFFNLSGKPIYIGKTNTNFLQRLTTQLDTTPYPGWGWNSLLRILGGNRTGKHHDELSEDDHAIDLEGLLDHTLLLIDVPRNTVDSTRLTRLERTLQKTFKEIPENELLNSNTGLLRMHEWEMTIEQIINQ